MRKSTLIATAVFAVLLVAAVYSMTRRPERGITRVSFTSLDIGAIDRVVVTGPNPIDIKSDRGVWRLPNGRAADSEAVATLLRTAALIQSSDLVTHDEARYADLEVDEAKGVGVQLFTGNRAVASLIVGKNVMGGVHVRVDKNVFKVRSLFTGAFSRPASEWAERRLYPNTKVADILRLNVQLKGGQPYTVAHGSDDVWGVMGENAKPADFRFDSNAAQLLMMGLLNMRAKDFVDKDPGVEVTGLGDTADSLTWFFMDTKEGLAGPHEGLRLGKSTEDKSGVYAQVDGKPDVYIVPEFSAASVRKSLLDLRDLRVMSFEPGNVTALELTNGKERLRFVKKDDAWSLDSAVPKAPKDFALDTVKIAQRLGNLSTARALGIAAGAAPATTGLTSPKQLVSLTFATGETAALRFGNLVKDAPSKDSVYASGNADKHVYILATALRDNLLGGLDTFKRTAAAADPMLNLDPKALTNLPPEIRDSIMRQIEQKRQEAQLLQQAKQH